MKVEKVLCTYKMKVNWHLSIIDATDHQLRLLRWWPNFANADGQHLYPKYYCLINYFNDETNWFHTTKYLRSYYFAFAGAVQAFPHRQLWLNDFHFLDQVLRDSFNASSFVDSLMYHLFYLPRLLLSFHLPSTCLQDYETVWLHSRDRRGGMKLNWKPFKGH